MGTSNDVERVAAPICAAAGLELVDVEFRSGNVVITLDRPGGVDLDALGAFSRELSGAIDRAEVGPSGRYELEVSSPGLERRLRRPEHFQRFVGSDVAVKTKPGVAGERRIEGRIVAADERSVTVAPAGDASPDAARTLRYDDIERAHTIFDWRAALAGTDAPSNRRERSGRAGSPAPADAATRATRDSSARGKGGRTRRDAGREVTETA